MEFTESPYMGGNNHANRNIGSPKNETCYKNYNIGEIFYRTSCVKVFVSFFGP